MNMIGHEKYSINEVSKDELTQIPGIDESTALAILDFRERRGWIHNLEELGDIEQIDDREMHELREWLTVASERSGSLDYEGQKEEPDIV